MTIHHIDLACRRFHPSVTPQWRIVSWDVLNPDDMDIIATFELPGVRNGRVMMTALVSREQVETILKEHPIGGDNAKLHA